MKKLLILLVIIAAAGGAYYFVNQKKPGSSAGTSAGTNPDRTVEQESAADVAMRETQMNPDELDEEGLLDDDSRPATEIYKNADDALKAVKDGALEYDDIVLEQFADMPEDCAWCDGFYKSINEMMLSPDTKDDQRSYYGEILATSGRLENIKLLTDAIKNAPNQELADIYSEALELAMGKDDVVSYLGEQLTSTNETLKEASVAAITNQGSRLAAELLYNTTVEAGNADGYYSLGIGLGELVPDDDTLPYLQELAQKRDQYSHLAVKALLNNGVSGLRIVVDTLTNSKDPDFDRKMLQDAQDHVSFDEETEAFLQQTLATSKDPVVQEFARTVLADLNSSEDGDEEADQADE